MSDGQTSWSQSGTLTVGNPTGRVSLQQIFDEAGEYSVQFSIAAQPDVLTIAEATITWKVDGNQNIRKVSVVNGMTISGVAEAVDVSVRDALPASIGVGGNPTYTVSISVVPGTRPAVQQPPTLTLFPGPLDIPGGLLFLVAPSTRVRVHLPIDCGAISILVTASTDGAGAGAVPIPPNLLPYGVAQVTQLVGVSATNMGGIFSKRYDPRDVDWMPLTPGCNAIELANFYPADTPILFSITLGIDG